MSPVVQDKTSVVIFVVLNEDIITVTNTSYVTGVKHVTSDVPAWYEVVMAFQVIGCIFAFMALFITLRWTIKHFTSEIQCDCYGKISLAAYVIAGIFILLGIIILVGETETKQIDWAPSNQSFSI
ncbi:Hypothetical predicted protein [Octopus vulgaris]|uniref:Uncharacterized protein n=1 Tax=Octopus vulgaris TaxID=6645 RepID=A0AA36BTD2_OCTVU|nr:Hypothetical predicted protein [Octopus vulgaris]